MNEKFDHKFDRWDRDFHEFMKSREIQAPGAVAAALLDRVREDLNPSAERVFLKFLSALVLAGGLTLTVCPQYGIGPIGGGSGLMGIFMRFGTWSCALFCGGFFMGCASVAALAWLKPEELKILLRYRFWVLGVGTVGAQMLLMAVGAQSFWFELTHGVFFNSLWLASAFGSAWLLLVWGTKWRRRAAAA